MSDHSRYWSYVPQVSMIALVPWYPPTKKHSAPLFSSRFRYLIYEPSTYAFKFLLGHVHIKVLERHTHKIHHIKYNCNSIFYILFLLSFLSPSSVLGRGTIYRCLRFPFVFKSPTSSRNQMDLQIGNISKTATFDYASIVIIYI